MKLLTRIGIIATVTWLALFAGILIWKLCDARIMSLNEWGDFLAGISAPLALLWLVIGYFQQGQELTMDQAIIFALEA